MTSADFPGVRWHGHWVAPDVPEFVIDPTSVGGDLPPAEFSRALFRRVFNVDDVPQRAPLRLSADSRYVLWVNGAEVGRGPIRSQPRRLRYDEYDIAPYLRPGRNAMAVLVTYYGHANSFWQPAASSGVMGRDAQVVVEARIAEEWLVTDERWRVLRSPAWRALGADQSLDAVPVELLDARELDPAWIEPEFDDTTWVAATVVKATHDRAFGESRPPVDPYGAMLPRGIGMLGGSRVAATSVTLQTATPILDLPDHPAQRLVQQLRKAGDKQTVQLPLKVDRTEDAVTLLTVNFGRIVAGHVELEVDAPSGVRLDLFYQESADYDAIAGPVDSAPRSSASYTTRGTADHYKAVDINGLRQIFLMIPSGAGEVTVRDIAVSEYHYPFTGEAAFSSSDPELDRLYQAGIRTTEMNSVDAFTDCPTREQRAWVGDGVVHQMVHLVANQDWRLARNYVALGASPRPDGMLPMTVTGEIEYQAGYTIPDWALHWIHGVWNLFRHDGDQQATLRLLPVVERVLRWYEPYIDDNGTLSDLSEWNLIDWSSVFSSHRSSLTTGLWARGLAEYAEMSDWLANTASAAWARGLWEQARQGYEDFWDPARGSYVDHIVEGERQPAMSQAAGAVAIVSGLAPQDRWSGIVDVVTDPARLVVRSWIGGEDGGYDMVKIVEHSQGIYRIDWDVDREVVLAEPFFSCVVHDAVAAAGRSDLLPDLLRRWSVFLQNGYDTFGECWGWGTPVHAWSATPTKDLIWYVLGVTPAEPGYGTVRIAPRPGTIERLAGAVPTPHGPVRVEVEHGQVRVDSPVPVRFVSRDGDESTASAGSSEFTL
jgi:alpha-L-rhamnosidase